MCNAWNHPAGCRCGWGGDGHLGKPGFNTFGAMASNATQPSYHSYVDPSARCPKCNSPVFFYQSPYGGRVYFDELGPPWPKHPCTTYEPPHIITRNILEVVPSSPTAYQWQQQGWKPFACMNTKTTDRNLTRIYGIFPDPRLPRAIAIPFARLRAKFGHPSQEYMFYLNETQEWFSHLLSLPLFIRSTDESPTWCEIATILLNETTLQPEPVYMRAAIPPACRELFMAEFGNVR